MKEIQKFDFQRHVASKGSKSYIFRMLIYVVLLGVMGVFIWYKFKTEKHKQKQPNKELNFKKIQLDQ